MSRWLLNYTPQATIVRLLTTDAINGYVTSWVLHITGGFEDNRLILPSWIIISTVLTPTPFPSPPLQYSNRHSPFCRRRKLTPLLRP